ncbi:preprotein translocase subunit SecG [Treponema sp.]|uniref:preprotein translocase subunit SecG n=1 Tax=Treponema sp. TaxID=166 RepID=UPI001E048662|nr:preprotein translocase subunit SecG [Treponema sp.]MBS7241045.1 preprotein translocase subunit SecG [Treponema sp.]MCI6442877.1 preprotein translocase subunit SecG [Spirochaetia bacterium]MDY4131715.1 preprotein translocase subunit SecG [Treponema sp.]
MGVVKTVLLVAFVIVCILAILLVLVQNDEGNGMGSAFGGGNSAAFGAHSGSVLKKTTGVLVVLFFVITIGLGLVNKASDKEDLSSTAAAVQGETKSVETESGNWLENELSGSTATVEQSAE